MRVVQINATANKGGTGRVCSGISELLTDEGIENYILYVCGDTFPNGISYATPLEIKLEALKSRIFGNYGFNSRLITKRHIKKIEEVKPDAVHLHNLHGHNVNLKMLFEYFKKNPQIKLVWTFHDCWTFTGYCPYFEMSKCDKWKTQCNNCPQAKNFSWFFDKSKKLFDKKRKLFSNLNLTIVTPSKWLADLVKQSFLKDYEVKVINNGIDIDKFKPTPSDFREKYNLENKKIVLGVADGWGTRKGIDVFIELSKMLPSDYQIVLVGMRSNSQIELPDNIISIPRTENIETLAKIYTSADVFVNPTMDDTYPTVNMEAVACGTPVVTSKIGGSPETIDEKTGITVDINDIEGFKNAIICACEGVQFSHEAFMEKAKDFDKKEKFKEYIELYK